MRPVRLEMRDFMSHKETAIDFGEIEIAAIIGPNGAGKSTILQAITYALWGQVRTASHNDVVRRGAGTCAVMLMFMADNTEYTVIRRRKLSGRGSSDLEFSISRTPSGKFIPLTKATLKETQAEIDRVLGMSYDAFSSSALLQQGEASRFSDARPGERKELLAEMLDLRWFQTLEEKARQMLRRINEELFSANALVTDKHETLDRLETNADEIDSAIEEAMDQKGYIEKRLNVEGVTLNAARTNLEDVKALETELEGKRELASSYEERKAEIIEQIKALTDREGALEKVLDQSEEIEAAKEKLDQLRQEKDEMAEMAIEHGRLQTASLGLEDDRHSLVETEVERDLLVERIGELKDDADKLEAREEEVNRELDELIDQAHKANAAVHRLVAIRETAGKRVTLLSSPGANCPTCNQSIADRKKVLEDAQEGFQVAHDAVVIAEEADGKAIALVEEAQGLYDEVKETADKNAQQLASLGADVRVLLAEIKGYKDKISHKEEAQHKLDALGFDQEAFDELREYIRENGGSIDEQYAALVAAGEEILRVGEEKQEAFGRLDKGVKMIGDLAKEIDTLTDQIATMPEISWLKERIQDIQTVVADLQDRQRENDLEIARLHHLKQDVTDLDREISNLESRIGQLEAEKRVCTLLIKAASKTGVQALVIEAAIPQLEKDANNLLLHMAHNMEIALQSQRLTQKGTATETLDIVVYSGGHVAPIETLSGGERFRADLSLRLAIGRMVARRSSAAIEMLAIDEGFGSQDGDGQEAVVEVISSLQGLFGLILVISHVQAVAEAIGSVGNMITVSKSGNESKVEVK